MLIRAEYGAAKHGTEMSLYRGDSPQSMGQWNRKLQLFVPLPDGGGPESSGVFPMGLGNMIVGRVTEVGTGVTRWKRGDRVLCHSHFREAVLRREGAVRAVPADVSWRAAVCLDPAEFALGAVRDGAVRLGDAVAVFGLGAIGLLIVAFALRQGAAQVFAVDPLPARRELALRVGASSALDSRSLDAAVAVREATEGRGADVTFEASGSYVALHEAIRTVAFGGTVVSASAYGRECGGGLMLGAEFHRNRPPLVSARANSDPNREHPRWNDARIIESAWRILCRGDIPCEQIVQPVVEWRDALDAYRWIDDHSDESIKLGVRFPYESTNQG